METRFINSYGRTFGVTASSTQCSNEWKAMKREYQKNPVDNNLRTGAEKKTSPFYV